MPSQLRTLPILLCMLFALGFAAEAAAATLKIATIMPDGSSWLVEMRKAGKSIEEKTAGRVKLKFYPGGVMGNDKTVLRKVRAGQLQGGAFTSGALSAVYPDIEIYSLPLLFRDQAEADFVRARMDETLKHGLRKKGFVALALTDGGFAYVLSARPFRELEDMRGAKMWLPEGDIMSDITLDLAGVSPVPLPIVDVYTALQTGLIDTVAAPPMGAIAFQWHTKIHYMTDVPLMYLMGVFAVERRAFDKLSPEDQAILTREVAAASERLDAESRIGNANARQALQNQGVEIVMPSSDEEVARWREISGQAIAKLRSMGRYSDTVIDELLGYVEACRNQGHTAAAGVP